MTNDEFHLLMIFRDRSSKTQTTLIIWWSWLLQEFSSYIQFLFFTSSPSDFLFILFYFLFFRQKCLLLLILMHPWLPFMLNTTNSGTITPSVVVLHRHHQHIRKLLLLTTLRLDSRQRQQSIRHPLSTSYRMTKNPRDEETKTPSMNPTFFYLHSRYSWVHQSWE